MDVNCTNCGATNRDSAKFCSECGTPFAMACPNCSSPTTPSDKFCSECGYDLVVAAPTEAAPHLVAAPPPIVRPEERRFITALFIDLVGFTALTEARDAEEVPSKSSVTKCTVLP